MSRHAALELSIVIPTYNERENIQEIVCRTERALHGRSYELIVVDDDSDDRTWELVETLSSGTANIRLARRRAKRRDFAQSIMEGFRLAQADVLGCMDADGSHPPEVIPQLLERLQHGFELVVGSRYIAGGSVSGWPLARQALSRVATAGARSLLALPIRDPLSGFYLVRRRVYERTLGAINPRGFKMLLELYVRGCPSSVTEVPFHFQHRRFGKSKLSTRVLWQGVAGLFSLMIARQFAANRTGRDRLSTGGF